MRLLLGSLVTLVFASASWSSELSIHSGFFDGEGEDSGFSLDGDLDSVEVSLKFDLTENMFIKVALQDRDGEFTLTTGEQTDYEATEMEMLLGYSFCLSSSCGSKLSPYVGYRTFEAENKLTAFGASILVEQDRDIVPIGVIYQARSGAFEYGLDVSLGRKISDDQTIGALGVDQSSEDNWTYHVEVPVRYIVDENFYVELRYELEEVKFSDTLGNRFAREENSQLTFGAGYRF